MREMTFEETKKVELNILKHIADFCESNNLQYFLAYGTLIGAVRHKGFIPWDDDIDIWMPREDYNKLIHCFKNTSFYQLISPKDELSRHTFVKIIDTRTVKLEGGTDYKHGYLGVDIDIFPLDGQPEDDEAYSRWYNKLFKAYRLYPYIISKNHSNFIKSIVINSARLFGLKKYILNYTYRLHRKYSYRSSNFVGAIESCYNSKNNRYLKEWFNNYILLNFEDKKFRVPAGYHEILTKTYGDYMQLPPPEQQVTHHVNNCFWR